MPCFTLGFTRQVAGRCARLFGSFTASDSRVRSSTRCECGTVTAHPCRCRPNHFARVGEKTVPQTEKAQTENPSRDQILQRIRDGLRTAVKFEEPATASD